MKNDAARRGERIESEAAGWLAAIECGAADRQAFEQWRSADPAHALAFIRVSQVARDLELLRETGVSERLAPLEEAPKPPSADRRRMLQFAAAGIFAAGLGGIGWVAAAAAHEVRTAVGERRRVIVANGIALELNTNSQVEWRDDDGVYDIRLLKGEVMLERLPGSAPCSLHCGQSQIELATDGRLNARVDARGVDLTVLKGEATLRNPGSAAALRVPALRKASLAGGEAPALSAISELDAGAISAWRQGQVQFNGETLERAVAEYNRYLSRPIEIADPSIRLVRLGGRFSATDPDDFCKALKELYGVSSRYEPGRISLARA